ncbi:MAG: ABC transporter substrate-binding protein [Dehalococcoidia bacterium]
MDTRRLLFVLGGIGAATVAVIVVLAVALSGGGDGDGNGNSPDGDGGPGIGEDLPARESGELRLFGPDPLIIDPACASDAGSARYIVEIFSGLVSFDRDLNLIPDIAESWETSDDGAVYTFNLRNNVLFHDSSRRVTAADFKFSIERALNPNTLSTVAEVYLDDIAGALTYARGQADEVEGIRVIDDSTLEITLEHPNPVFLFKLSYPVSFVVDQREVGDSTCFSDTQWTLNPNGTGPFRLTEWALGQRIELEPNPNYYLDPKPSLAKVTYIIAGGSPFTMYENDEVDITGVGANDIERVRDPNEPLNAEFVEGESLDVFYIGFNTEEPPFDDPRIRRALDMAIDKELIANTILAELVAPANGILPPGLPGYNPDLEGLPYDPQAARDLLDEAGGPEVLDDVVLLTPGRGASPSDVLEAIVALWDENLGVNIAIEQREFGLFLRDIDETNFQMFSLGWIADYPDPQNFLEIKLHSRSANNETLYSNPEVDALLDEARTEFDEQARFELYRQAEEIIVNDAPWIPLYHGKTSALIKPYVDGYEVPPFVLPNLRYVTIDK